MLETRSLREIHDSEADEQIFVSRSIEAQSFADYLTETDTDTENASLPHSRRWVWYCKSRYCPKYHSVWTCKTNFLLHLYETPIHREDPSTKTCEGRRLLARSWKEETAYDLSEPKKQPPAMETSGNTSA